MKQRRAWMLIVGALVVGLMPMASAWADGPSVNAGPISAGVEEATPWICVIHQPVGVCVPPW